MEFFLDKVYYFPFLSLSTLALQRYGNPLKNPICYNRKVPLVKCLKSPLLVKNTTERLVNISLVLNFLSQGNLFV